MRRSHRYGHGRALGLGLLGCLALGACTSSDRDAAPTRSVTHVAEAGDVIDQNLMVALAQAKNFHHKAKVYRSDDNLPAAIAAVREILSLRFPAAAPEAEDVRNDARALLATLLVEQGNLEEAMRTVSEGLAQSTRDSFFVANLHTVEGQIHEARAEAAKAENRTEVLAAERRAAIDAYDRSIKINEALQKKLAESR